jgi:hypothetical protein
MEFFIVWVALAIVVGVVANSRGRSGGSWFLLSLPVSPLIAGLLVFALPNLRRQGLHRIEPRESQKCPYCAESIKVKAIVCNHCGREIPFSTFPTRPIKRATYPIGVAVSVIATAIAGVIAFGGHAFWKNLFKNATDQYQLTTFAADQLQSTDSGTRTSANTVSSPSYSEPIPRAGMPPEQIIEHAKADSQRPKPIEVSRRRASQKSTAAEQKQVKPATPIASPAPRADASR